MRNRLSLDTTTLLDHFDEGFIEVPEAILILSALSHEVHRAPEDVPRDLSLSRARRWLIESAQCVHDDNLAPCEAAAADEATSLFLMFSDDERRELGEEPLEHLLALLQSARAGDRNAIEAACSLAQKLAQAVVMVRAERERDARTSAI